MPLSRQSLYALFVSLLVASLAFSMCNVGNAADVTSLPASADDATPLATGDQAPAFTVQTVDGDDFIFDPGKLERPAVLISYRGGWCPYCNTHLSELRTVIPGIREMGLDVLFISNDRPDQLYSGLQMETKEDIEGLDYVILSDAELQAALAFGTAFRTTQGLHDYLDGKERDYAGSSIDKYNALGIPFVYVVDTSGMIVFDFVEPNYKVRISADDLLAAAEAAAR